MGELEANTNMLLCATSQATDSPSDFVTSFPDPIDNSAHDLQVALIACQMTYKIDNITAADNNNSIRFLQPGHDPTDPDEPDWEGIGGETGIPDGMYTLTQLNAVILAEMVAASLCDTDATTGLPISPIRITANSAIGKVIITLKKGWSIGLTDTDGRMMWKFLGFTAGIYTAPSELTDPDYTVFNGDLFPDINRGIMALNIHCSIASGGLSYSGAKDVIGTVIPNVGVNQIIVNNVQVPIFLPVNRTDTIIREIHFWITDQYNNTVTISGDPTVIILGFKRTPREAKAQSLRY
jgi:hypothetical protein